MENEHTEYRVIAMTDFNEVTDAVEKLLNSKNICESVLFHKITSLVKLPGNYKHLDTNFHQF